MPATFRDFDTAFDRLLLHLFLALICVLVLGLWWPHRDYCAAVTRVPYDALYIVSERGRGEACTRRCPCTVDTAQRIRPPGQPFYLQWTEQRL